MRGAWQAHSEIAICQFSLQGDEKMPTPAERARERQAFRGQSASARQPAHCFLPTGFPVISGGRPAAPRTLITGTAGAMRWAWEAEGVIWQGVNRRLGAI